MYKLLISNPISDLERKIVGNIEFKFGYHPPSVGNSGNPLKFGYAIGSLSNLPNPFINKVSGLSMTIPTIGPIQSNKVNNPIEEDVIQEVASLLKSEFLMKFGYNIELNIVSDNSIKDNIIEKPISNEYNSELTTNKLREYVFNVELEKVFRNDELGDLTIVSKMDNTYIFNDSQDTIDPEYIEGEFSGEEESAFLIPVEDEIEFDNAFSNGDISGSSIEDNTPINPGTLKGNMKLIAEALKSVGFTNKYAIYSIIAIASGESRLKPQNEGHVYGRDRIGSVFPGLSQNQRDRATIRGISKRSFFSIIYGEYRPNRIGNRNVSDGGLYFGRGFIQITGYGLYLELNNLMKRYFPKENINILNNPDLLNNPQVSAKVTALFYIQKGMINISQDSNFFEKALRKTGNDAGGGYAKKRNFYNKLLSGNNNIV